MDEKIRAIIIIASELYSNYGIRAVTMDDVAKGAGVSKKTLYKYFTDKSHLVKAVIESKLKAHKEQMARFASEETNAIEELWLSQFHILDFYKEIPAKLCFELKKHYPDLLKIREHHKKENLYENIKRNINKGIKQGVYREECDADYIALFFTMIVEKLAEEEIAFDMAKSGKRLFGQLFDYHLRAIVNDAGLVLFNRIIKTVK